jgi:gamma-glutamyltranspeptidase/glutathione hydrolase/leukotriene-C4 hydrolase
MESPEWVEIFAPNGTLADIGDTIQRPALAKTLEIIANKGPDAFYDGPVAESIVNTVIDHGGIISLDDLKNYKALQRPVIQSTYHKYNVYTTSAPTSGPVLLNILNIIEPYNFTSETTLTMHHLVEAFKFGYAARTELGDPSFTKNQDRLQEIITKEWADHVRGKIHDVSSIQYNFFF